MLDWLGKPCQSYAVSGRINLIAKDTNMVFSISLQMNAEAYFRETLWSKGLLLLYPLCHLSILAFSSASTLGSLTLSMIRLTYVNCCER